MMKLKAGGVEISYENGALRTFMAGEKEVLRMIYFAVRDENWTTYVPEILNETVDRNEDSFEIRYEARYVKAGEIFMEWQVRINGSNRISFEIDGKVLKPFKTNRAGFCILHPLEGVSGEELTLLHSDGTSETAVFPEFVAPHQPFFDLRGMEWQVGDALWRLDFEGDIFETEDQRNWGDASYKTYCTPLTVPFPRLLPEGERIGQKVSFSRLGDGLSGKSDGKEVRANRPVKLGIASSGRVLTPELSEKISLLELDHYRLELELKEGWQAELAKEVANAARIRLPLYLVLLFSKNREKELLDFKDFVSNEPLEIKYLLVLSKNELVSQSADIGLIDKLKAFLPKTSIGAGTLYNFTELNRFRFEPGRADFIAFSFNPQEHAADDRTLMENTETPVYLAASARAMYGLPVHLSPVSLKRRFNPYASEEDQKNLSVERQADERQKTQFGRAWTQALLESLAKSDVESATLMQVSGDLGIMDEEDKPYPVYEALKALRKAE